MRLIAEFDIEGTPELINAIGRKSWYIKARSSKLWRSRVSNKCYLHKISGLGLDKAVLTYTRHSMKQPDFDNLAISFKACQDGLVDAGVLVDDKPQVIGAPTYLWKFRERRLGGMISIKIEVDEP